MAFASGVIAVGCGDDDGGKDEATGGRNNSATGGRNGSTGGRATTGGTQGEDGGAPPAPTDGGAPTCQGSLIDTFVPQTDQDPGPDCQAYADCMEEGCGELYEPAFGADWADGDLSGGACGPTVPCLEDCGCDATCAQNCIFTNLDCAGYAIQLQGCYMDCAGEFMACQAERM